MEIQPTISDLIYKVYWADGRVRYINDVIHSLAIYIDTYVEQVDFHVMNLYTIDILLGYPSLSIDLSHHLIIFTSNDCTHFIQCVKNQSPLIVSAPSVSDLTCSTLIYYVLDPEIQVYKINSAPYHLFYFEQQLLDKILNDFHDVFPSKLPHGLPSKRNIDHHIDLLLGVAPICIPRT